MERRVPALICVIGLGVAIAGIAAILVFASTFSVPQFWALVTAFTVLGATSGVCLILSPAQQGVFFICIVAALLSIFAADIYVWFGNRSPYEGAADRMRAGATQRELVIRLRAANDPAVPLVPPSIFLQDEIASRPAFRRASEDLGGKVPISGIANRTTVYCSEKRDYWTIYKSDRHGFNNPDEVWDGVADIAAVGDSFTHGACVPPGKGMVDLIRNRFPRTVNLGMAGSGPLLMLAEIREFGAVLKPKTVIWFFYEGNDLEDAAREYRSPAHRAYLDGTFRQGLAETQRSIDSALSAAVDSLLGDEGNERSLATETAHSNWLVDILLLRNLRQALLLRLGRTQVSSTDGLDTLKVVLATVRSELQAWGGRVCFVNLPSWEGLFRPNAQQNERRKATLDAVRELGIHVVDLHAVMAEVVRSGRGDDLFYYPGSHYSEAGYERVATALLPSDQDGKWACDPP